MARTLTAYLNGHPVGTRKTGRIYTAALVYLGTECTVVSWHGTVPLAQKALAARRTPSAYGITTDVREHDTTSADPEVAAKRKAAAERGALTRRWNDLAKAFLRGGWHTNEILRQAYEEHEVRELRAAGNELEAQQLADADRVLGMARTWAFSNDYTPAGRYIPRQGTRITGDQTPLRGWEAMHEEALAEDRERYLAATLGQPTLQQNLERAAFREELRQADKARLGYARALPTNAYGWELLEEWAADEDAERAQGRELPAVEQAQRAADVQVASGATCGRFAYTETGRVAADGSEACRVCGLGLTAHLAEREAARAANAHADALLEDALRGGRVAEALDRIAPMAERERQLREEREEHERLEEQAAAYRADPAAAFRAGVAAARAQDDADRERRRHQDRERILASIVDAHEHPGKHDGLQGRLVRFRELHAQALELNADPERRRTDEWLALEGELRVALLAFPTQAGAWGMDEARSLADFRVKHLEALAEERHRQDRLADAIGVGD